MGFSPWASHHSSVAAIHLSSLDIGVRSYHVNDDLKYLAPSNTGLGL